RRNVRNAQRPRPDHRLVRYAALHSVQLMNTLFDIIAAEAKRTTFPAAQAFADELRQRYGAATAAVIFYGSCLRQATDEGLILDFYVVVDRYRPALGNPVSAFFAALLPPNVYYHEM